MVVNGLEVHLACEQEVGAPERRIGVERASEREPNRVLDEARLEMRVLDDEELVGAFEQLVDGRAHRVLDDAYEPFGVDPLPRAHVEGAAAALVVRGEGNELEDPVDVEVVEAGLAQPVGGPGSDESLRARTRVDPGGLDAD